MSFTKAIEGKLVDLGDIRTDSPGAVFMVASRTGLDTRLELIGLTIGDCRQLAAFFGDRAKITITVEKVST